MKIREIRLKNFQRHEDLTLKFSDGFNVIVGESGEGKTSIKRALRWVAHNKPIGAAKSFQRKNTKSPIEVTVVDSLGHTITRTKNKYIINDMELTAFNKSVPNEVQELLPFKEINWHGQLDSHFLVLDAPGPAAKFIHKAIGMEDQELILKEVKARLSAGKSEIRRTVERISEEKEKIRKLRKITEFHEKAQKLKEQETEILETSFELNQLDGILQKIKKIGKPVNPNRINAHIEKINILIEKLLTIQKEEKCASSLGRTLEKLGVTKTSDFNFNAAITRVGNLITNLLEIKKQEKAVKKLGDLLQNIKSIKSEIKQNKIILDRKQKEYDDIFKSLEICPYCNSKLRGKKDAHSTCRG